MHSGHGTLGLQLTIIDGEHESQIRAWGKNGAGFHVTAAHADVDQVAENWAAFIFRIQLNGDAAFHAWIEPAVFAAWLFLLFYIHASVGFSEEFLRILAIVGVHRLSQAQGENLFAANLESSLLGQLSQLVRFFS